MITDDTYAKQLQDASFSMFVSRPLSLSMECGIYWSIWHMVITSSLSPSLSLCLSVFSFLCVVCIQGIPNDNDRRLSQYDANYSLPSFLFRLSIALTAPGYVPLVLKSLLFSVRSSHIRSNHFLICRLYLIAHRIF